MTTAHNNFYKFKEMFTDRAQRHRDAAAVTQNAMNYRMSSGRFMAASERSRKHTKAANLIDAFVGSLSKNSSEWRATTLNAMEAAQKDAIAADNDALEAMRRNNPDTAFAPLMSGGGRRKKTKSRNPLKTQPNLGWAQWVFSSLLES